MILAAVGRTHRFRPVRQINTTIRSLVNVNAFCQSNIVQTINPGIMIPVPVSAQLRTSFVPQTKDGIHKLVNVNVSTMFFVPSIMFGTLKPASVTVFKLQFVIPSKHGTRSPVSVNAFKTFFVKSTNNGIRLPVNVNAFRSIFVRSTLFGAMPLALALLLQACVFQTNNGIQSLVNSNAFHRFSTVHTIKLLTMTPAHAFADLKQFFVRLIKTGTLRLVDVSASKQFFVK